MDLSQRPRKVNELISRLTDRGTLGVTIIAGAAFVLFIALPLVSISERAFREGLFLELARHPSTLSALRLSLITSSVTLLTAIIGGTPAAYFLARSRFRGNIAIEVILILPIVMPPTTAGVALLTAFGQRGLVGQPLAELFGVTFGFSTFAVIMAQTLVAAPIYLYAVKSGFESVDKQLEDVAYTLGASKTATFFRITVPQAYPSLLAGAALCWTRSAGELGATLIFAGNLQHITRTMPLEIITSLEGHSLGLAGAIAQSVILMAVSVGIVIILRLITARTIR